jgi:hypothetical protein
MFDSLISLMRDAGYVWFDFVFSETLSEKYEFTKGKITFTVLDQFDDSLLIGCPKVCNACYIYEPYLDYDLTGHFGKYIKFIEDFNPQTKVVGFVRDNSTDFFIHYSPDLKAKDLGECPKRLRITNLNLMKKLDNIILLNKQGTDFLFSDLVYDGEVDINPANFESWLERQTKPVLSELAGISD